MVGGQCYVSMTELYDEMVGALGLHNHLFLNQVLASLSGGSNVQDRCLLGKALMVPKQVLEKAEAACLLSHIILPSIVS